MKACAVNLGCKVNEYETQSMLMQLKNAGYKIVDWPSVADVYIVNTCAVTNIGERKSRQFLTKVTKLNSKAKIVVCGCAVQNNPTNFLVNKNVIAVVGNHGKNAINDLIKSQNKELLLLPTDYQNMERPLPTKTRQYIKIQDGCNNFCSYCIIPYLRGRSRSRAIDDILDEIKNTKSNEIVLTGIDMSDYRIDGQRALKTLLIEIDKLNIRFRISSLECGVIDKDLVEMLKNSKNFCQHFHLSLQSACNNTLKRMNRHYTIEEFKKKVKLIRTAMPNACISTDIIVGFKGETDEEFETTFNNLKDIHFNFMHIFPYSIREGTVASKLGGDIDKTIVKEREAKLQKLNMQFKKDFYESNLGLAQKLLVEDVDKGCSFGYTGNYIYTHIPKKLKVGSIVEVKLTKANSTYMDGTI